MQPAAEVATAGQLVRALCAGLLLACTEAGADLRPGAPTAEVGPAPPTLGCTLALEPTAADFLPGERHTFTLRSAGEEDCIVRVLDTDFELFAIEAPEAPLPLTAGSEVSIRVRLIAPVHTWEANRTLRVYASGGAAASAVLAPVTPPSVRGCLAVTPTHLDFTDTVPGEPAAGEVTVANACDRYAFIEGAATVGPFSLTDSSAREISPSGTASIAVRHRATDRFDDGELLIYTNDATSPRFSIRLRGTSAVPYADLLPEYDLGATLVGCDSDEYVAQLWSSGTRSLTVAAVEITGADAGAFEVVALRVGSEPVQLPVVLPPEDGLEIGLRFGPQRIGPHQAALTVRHDASASQASLLGTGLDESLRIDEFTQLDGARVDVLFVVDDSCSMTEEQDQLVSNMLSFAAYLETVPTDFQIGVTTTSVLVESSAGVLRQCAGHPPIITSDYADAGARADALACLLEAGIHGFNPEAGLQAAKRALERARDGIGNNAGLLRDNARLEVVIVSDEDDQSSESDGDLLAFFDSIKGHPDLASINAIAGPTQGACPTGSAPGHRYHWMTQQTGGLYQDICVADWQALLFGLELDTFVPIDTWRLTATPDPSSLVVEVEGAVVPPDPADGYTYLGSSRSIRFNGTALPGPGATITVRYDPACGP